jgi:hypothetical protein
VVKARSDRPPDALQLLAEIQSASDRSSEAIEGGQNAVTSASISRPLSLRE